jgi:hypothetical protein
VFTARASSISPVRGFFGLLVNNNHKPWIFYFILFYFIYLCIYVFFSLGPKDLLKSKFLDACGTPLPERLISIAATFHSITALASALM